jgi:glutamyl-tRNA synthetase
VSRGRFAPSPTGPLHLGNLRTALAAWLFARAAGSEFVLRFEDLDPIVTSRDHETRQLRELELFGLDWDGEPMRQSEHLDRYRTVVQELRARDLSYLCWCTRREIREAAQAPHHPTGHYPGTCRLLTDEDRQKQQASGRPAAVRLATGGESFEIVDRLTGPHRETIDDLVLERADGTPAYNLAVVVDDAAQGIEEVVRGDDLLSTTPRQAYLQQLLGYPEPIWAHVPLVLSPTGERLAKRDGAVTLEDRIALGDRPERVVSVLAASLGLQPPDREVRPADLLETFDPSLISRSPWTMSPTQIESCW